MAEEASAALSNLSESSDLHLKIILANGIQTAIKTLTYYEETLIEGRERSPEIHTYPSDFLVHLLSNSMSMECLPLTFPNLVILVSEQNELMLGIVNTNSVRSLMKLQKNTTKLSLKHVCKLVLAEFQDECVSLYKQVKESNEESSMIKFAMSLPYFVTKTSKFSFYGNNPHRKKSNM